MPCARAWSCSRTTSRRCLCARKRAFIYVDCAPTTWACSARVDYSENAAGAEKADVVVAIVGEDPYAEGSGDRQKLELLPQDLALIDAAKRSGKPVVVVLISGRPLILGDVLDSASAVVAAWLPGTEGDGVADVLYGAYKPTGKLSCSWPANMSQVPINVGDPRYAPLFPYGHGLSW